MYATNAAKPEGYHSAQDELVWKWFACCIKINKIAAQFSATPHGHAAMYVCMYWFINIAAVHLHIEISSDAKLKLKKKILQWKMGKWACFQVFIMFITYYTCPK